MSKTGNTVFKSEVLCLRDVVDYSFSIPTYQRPYVWGDEQLKKIIDDFYKAFKSNKDENYYISTLITKDNGVHGTNSELIDGQQRFTTLWLIALSISQLAEGTQIEQFLKKDDKIRLSFEIREEVSEYLSHLLKSNTETKSKYIQNAASYPYLKNIAKALKSIEGFIKNSLATNGQEFEEELRAFGDYIYTKVYFIKNTTPPNTDLNKLFSTINNSGVQLEQTDIVKANLLRTLDNKVLYARIWETCENMNNFFERNARASFPAPATDWENIDLTKQYEFNEHVFKCKSEEHVNRERKVDEFSIEKFDSISDYPFDKTKREKEKGRESEEVYCRSIINFGQLLLHTYRLHLKIEKRTDFEGTFHVNRLIEIFKELEGRNDSEEIRRFFLLLWKVRYLFDKYIIKWISDTNTKNENLELVGFSKNPDNYYSRTPLPQKSKSLILQSVLYFTGDYLRQYWISSYLDYLYYHHNNEKAISEEHLKYLEKIDDTFSLTKSMTDKELSWKMMHQISDFSKEFSFNEYLKEWNGTGFKHYWFYKLEYVLWKNWEFNKNEKFNSYRITSKNSVEHIAPQNPDNDSQINLDAQHLHSFGNLVLLSVAQNSEYSNKSFAEKKVLFEKRKESYDTLKSFYIFQKTEWTKQEIEDHQNLMIEKLINHYRND